MLLLLPERRRFSGQALAPDAARRLGRGDRLADAAPGERAQLLRHFELLPRGWPMAALTRELDAGDAGSGLWLRADPVYLRADANGARLQAWATLGLEAEESEDFLASLRPAFGDAGMALSAATPERWYLSLAAGAPLPEFVDPADAVGGELLSVLPGGPEGRRWRALFNEAQVILHQHPRNAAREAAGLAPVNGLWFWGAGQLPQAVRTRVGRVLSGDCELLALARRAGIAVAGAQAGEVDPDAPPTLVDLRRQRDWAKVQRIIADAGTAGTELALDFADGARWRLQPRQRWRFWRAQLTDTAFHAAATAAPSAEPAP
jgi:hypothetical protein